MLNDRSKLRKKLYSPQVFFLLLILVILVVKATVGVYWKRAESIDNLAKVTQEANALEARHAELTGDIAKLQTPSGVETEIRKKFSVVKDGEQMVVLVDDENKPAPLPPPPPGFWKRMWNGVTGFFGHKDATSTAPTSEVGTPTKASE